VTRALSMAERSREIARTAPELARCVRVGCRWRVIATATKQTLAPMRLGQKNDGLVAPATPVWIAWVLCKRSFNESCLPVRLYAETATIPDAGG